MYIEQFTQLLAQLRNSVGELRCVETRNEAGDLDYVRSIHVVGNSIVISTDDGPNGEAGIVTRQ